ncbi:hypothetical protein CBS101457_004277 [Exobasidium rhododendri]|nr:hypothetical protein CBS101457_004277 [Exobasidium rhododendri]
MPAKRNSKGAEKVASPVKSTSKDAKIDGRVSTSQVGKALSALAQYREKASQSKAGNDLPLEGRDDLVGDGSRVDRNDVVWMQITVKRLNANAPIKAIRFPLPHAIWPKSSSVCLLTADPQRHYKDLMVEEKLVQVKRVVGVTKLKGKFAPYEARRQLMNEHDVFLADDRIIPMLPKLLGKKWMQDRKSPIAVKLTRTKNDHLKKEFSSALASTYFSRNKGTCSSIRLGTLSHLDVSELKENMEAVLPTIVAKHVKGGWENVQSVDIKTGNSAALPVWNSKLEDRWIGMPEAAEATEIDDAEEESISEEAKKSQKKATPIQKIKAVETEKKTRSSISQEKVAANAGGKAKKTKV